MPRSGICPRLILMLERVSLALPLVASMFDFFGPIFITVIVIVIMIIQDECSLAA